MEIIDWCWCGLNILQLNCDARDGEDCFISSLSLFLSLRPLLVSTTSQNQWSLHEMCASCVWAQSCLHVDLKSFMGILNGKSSCDVSRHCSQILSTQTKSNPIVFALCQRMTCMWIHIWTGAYMSNWDDALLLVSRRQRSWMLLLSEIPEQENMQNFPKWVQYYLIV